MDGCKEAVSHVVIDAVGARHSGAAVVLREIVAAADRTEARTRVLHTLSPELAATLKMGRRVEGTVIKGATSPLGRTLWGLRRLGCLLSRLRCDAFLGLNGLGPTSPKSPPSTVFVQQALPYSREALQLCALGQQLRMRVIRWITARSVRAAAHVIVQTPSMKAALQEHLGVSAEKISVIAPNAPELPLVGERPHAWPREDIPVILYVGNAERYKNLKVVAAGVRFLHTVIPIHFVATISASDAAAISTSLVALGNLGREELKWAYEQASILVMPSLTESLGLPLLEAMRLGTPILAADRPYAHDVCGDAATYFDPHSPTDFARQAEKLLNDEELRLRQVARGREIVAALDATDPYRAMINKTIEVAKASRCFAHR